MCTCVYTVHGGGVPCVCVYLTGALSLMEWINLKLISNSDVVYFGSGFLLEFLFTKV